MDKYDRQSKLSSGCMRCRHAGYAPYLSKEEEKRLEGARIKFGATYFCRVLDKPVTTDKGKTCPHWASDK